MPVRTFDSRTSLSIVLANVTYTRGMLKADPEGAPHVATFVDLRQQWTGVHDKEVSLREAITDTQALVDYQNGRLNTFTYKLVGVLDDLTGEDRKHELFRRFFGRKTPSAFRSFSLGKKQAAMAEWSTHLEKAEDAALKALASELAALMADAAKALAARTEAEAARDQFRYAGERSAFIEEVNGARKALWGALAKRQHENSKLPKDFADRFFRHDSADEDEEPQEPTIESVTAELEELQKQVDTKAQQLKDLEAARAAEQAIAAKAQMLAAIGKQKAELDQQQAEIQAELDAHKAKKPRKGKKASPKARK